jgi:phosphoglucosamine mutase
MSNAGLEKHLANCGINLERTNVGDRYLVERINEKGLSLAGENSGHLIIKEINPTGDGIVASLMILKILSESGRKLSELADEIELYPQIQAKVKVMEKTPIEEIPGLCELIKSQEALLEGGRMLVRYSGTEPVMRVMAEGPDSTKVQNAVNQVADFVKNINGGK